MKIFMGKMLKRLRRMLIMLVKEYIRSVKSFKEKPAQSRTLVDLKTQESKPRSELFLVDEVKSEVYMVYL